MRQGTETIAHVLTELLISLTNGASVRVSGTLTDSRGAGQAKELHVSEVEVIGECDPEVRRRLIDL